MVPRSGAPYEPSELPLTEDLRVIDIGRIAWLGGMNYIVGLGSMERLETVGKTDESFPLNYLVNHHHHVDEAAEHDDDDTRKKIMSGESNRYTPKQER